MRKNLILGITVLLCIIVSTTIVYGTYTLVQLISIYNKEHRKTNYSFEVPAKHNATHITYQVLGNFVFGSKYDMTEDQKVELPHIINGTYDAGTKFRIDITYYKILSQNVTVTGAELSSLFVRVGANTFFLEIPLNIKEGGN